MSKSPKFPFLDQDQEFVIFSNGCLDLSTVAEINPKTKNIKMAYDALTLRKFQPNKEMILVSLGIIARPVNVA